jgi:hypothetical protein
MPAAVDSIRADRCSDHRLASAQGAAIHPTSIDPECIDVKEL